MKRLTHRHVVFILSLALTSVPTLGPRHATAQAETVRTVDIVVDGGYRPNRITAHAGERIRLRFVRHDYTPCTRDVVFPTLGIRRTLPTDEPVVIELPALEAGEYAFHCGMNMIHGALVVVAR